MATLQVLVNGKLRLYSREAWDSLEGPKPENPTTYTRSNGCTMSPDYIRGKRTWPACVIHDYQYIDTGVDRRESDAIFRRNLKRYLRFDGMNRVSASIYAFTYWRAVRRLGGSFYHGDEDGKWGDPS